MRLSFREWRWLFALVATLLGFAGVIAVWSAGHRATGVEAFGASVSQLAWWVAGVAVMGLLSQIDLRTIQQWAGLALSCGGGVLLVTDVAANGPGRREIHVGHLGFDPSPIVVVLFIVWLSSHLIGRRSADNDRRYLWSLGVATALVVAMLVQHNLGDSLLVASVALVVLFVAGAPWFSLLTVIAVSGAALLSIMSTSQGERLTAFLHPFRDPLGVGYQNIELKFAMADGGLSGRHLGAGIVKSYLVHPQSQGILAVIGEEGGLIAAAVLVLAYAALVWIGITYAVRCPDGFGRLAATGATAQIGVAALVTSAATVGVAPPIELPLPFVSAGGSNLLAMFASAGIITGVTSWGRRTVRQAPASVLMETPRDYLRMPVEQAKERLRRVIQTGTELARIDAGDPTAASRLQQWQRRVNGALNDVYVNRQPRDEFAETLTPDDDDSLLARLALVQAGVRLLEVFADSLDDAEEVSSHPGRSKLFIVHGHNHKALRAVRMIAEDIWGSDDVTVLRDLVKGANTTIEVFERHAASAAYVVVIFTGDDIIGQTVAPSFGEVIGQLLSNKSRNVPAANRQPRPNVLFEAGFFMAALGRNDVIVLKEEHVKLPSDIEGINAPAIDEPGWEETLRREIKKAREDFERLHPPAEEGSQN